MGGNILLFVALIAVALAAVPLGRRLTGDYFPPGVLVLGSWSATLGLYVLGVISYPVLAGRTLLLIVASIGALLLGSWVGQRSGQRRRPRSVPAAYGEACVAVMSVLGVLGVLWYVAEVAQALGLHAFLDRPAEVRRGLNTGTIPSRYLALEYLCVATPILAAALRVTGQRLRPWVWTMVVVCTLGTWITTDRTQFFLVALTIYFIVVFWMGPRLTLARLTGVTGAVLGGLGAFFLLIGVWQGKTSTDAGLDVAIHVPTLAVNPLSGPQTPGQDQANSGVPVGSTSSWLEPLQRSLKRTSTIYLYATASYAALDVLLANPEPRTLGLHSIYPLGRLLERAGVVSEMPPAIPPFVPLGLTRGQDVSFNGYTFLYYPVSDFGPVGGFLYAGIVGVIAGFAHGRFSRNRESAFWLLVMGHLSTALVLTVFVNKFNNTASWYVFLWSLSPFILARVVARSRQGVDRPT
jgi:hypothetical protein